DEVDDVEGPANRLIVAPDAYPREDEVDDRPHHHVRQHEGDGEADPPAQRRALAQDERAYLVGHGAEGVPRLDDGGRHVYARVVVWIVESLHKPLRLLLTARCKRVVR